MNAAAVPGPRPHEEGVPFADATPAQVRAALPPESAARFYREWRLVMTRAIDTLDLTEVMRTMDTWRAIARRAAAEVNIPADERSTRTTGRLDL